MADGRRDNGSRGSDKQQIMFLGDSFVNGWAVSDEETFLWKVQNRLPEYAVENYGVGGHSTYQSLMLLDRLLTKTQNRPTVIYGFSTVDADRNVATEQWLRFLTAHSRRGHVQVPYVTLDGNNALSYHPPAEHWIWPLSNRSAFMNVLQNGIQSLVTRQRSGYKDRATQLLILEMARRCEQRCRNFGVVILTNLDNELQPYANFLKSKNIPFADCTMTLTPDLTVEGEGHPNPKGHQLWADCVEGFLKSKILSHSSE